MEKNIVGTTGTLTNFGFTSKHEVGSEGWLEEGFKFPTPNKNTVAAQKEIEKSARTFAASIIKNISGGPEVYGPVLALVRQTMLKAGAALTYKGLAV